MEHVSEEVIWDGVLSEALVAYSYYRGKICSGCGVPCEQIPSAGEHLLQEAVCRTFAAPLCYIVT